MGTLQPGYLCNGELLLKKSVEAVMQSAPFSSTDTLVCAFLWLGY